MWGWFSLWPGPRSIQKSTTSPASQALVQSPVLSASTQLPLTSGRWAFLWVQQKKMSTPSEKFSTDGAHLCYRLPVQFERRTGSPISRDSAASASSELPPSRAGVDVVCPLLPLEVVFYNITVSLLFNAFWQSIQDLVTIKQHKARKKGSIVGEQLLFFFL